LALTAAERSHKAGELNVSQAIASKVALAEYISHHPEPKILSERALFLKITQRRVPTFFII
jgi:hypothetical protein